MVATGSNICPFDPFSEQMSKGQIGESVVDESVWMIKASYQWSIFEPKPFVCNKMIITVRNPFEVIAIRAQQNFTYTQDKHVDFDLPSKYPEFWEEFIKQEIQDMVEYYESIFKIFRERNVPHIFIKFEELLREPQVTLEKIFKFQLNTQDLEGTYVETRIKNAVEKIKNEEPSKFDDFYAKAEDMFTEDQKQLLLTKLYDPLEFFGYFKQPESEIDNP